MITNFKIFEDADSAETREGYNVYAGDEDAVPFVWNPKEKQVYVGDFGDYHSDSGIDEINGFQGRIWFDSELISCWHYPPPEQMVKFVPALEDALFTLTGDKLDIWNFDIEIDNPDEHKIITVKEYAGLKEKPEDVPEEKYLMHLMNPMQKAKMKPSERIPGWKPKGIKYKLPGESDIEAKRRLKYMYQEKNNPNKMIKQYNEFMCAHCGEDIDLRIGQTYFVDGKRMKLISIIDGKYRFQKGTDFVVVPEEKLDRWVSERKKHLITFNEMANIGLQISGVKCDNPDCDWEDPNVSVDDYAEWVNKLCPKCKKEVIITQNEYDQVQNLLQAADMLSMFSEEDLETIQKNMTPEETDMALDIMNDLGMKKTGEKDEEGREEWSMTIKDKKRDEKEKE